MRDSVNDPYTQEEAFVGAQDISDYQAADNTSGVVFSLVNLFFKVMWIGFMIISVCAISFPYLFPDWAEGYQKELQEMGIAANTGRFLKNAQKVDWKEAFTKANLKNLKLVGTGRHPRFKKDTELRKHYWYAGKFFIMKSYVSEGEWLRFFDEKIQGKFNHMPATYIEHFDAARYCHSQKGRLPTYEELEIAYKIAFNKKWQKAVGDILKPNLVLGIHGQYSLWTSTPEGDGFYNGDNFRLFTPGINDERYKDDGFSDATLSFLCVKDEAER